MKPVKFRVWTGKTMEPVYQLQFLKRGVVPRCQLPGFNNRFKVYEECPILQYTGGSDMNKKYIYEGDLLNLSFGIPPTTALLEVVACAGGFKVISRNGAKPSEMSMTEFYDDGMNDSCYVVGNIFQDKELMERNGRKATAGSE